MQGALLLQEVGVRFGGLRAVDGVSLHVPAGQRLGIIGPNGAGKTTLFNAVTGAARVTSGRVALDGADITRLPVHARAHRGMGRTFQVTNLFPALSIAESMRLALRGVSPARFSLFGADRLRPGEHARADASLRLAGLGGHSGRLVRELSYGEQRQLELAMALAAQPRILLLDEPAAGLSPAERGIVSGIVRSLPRTVTLVLIEHDMDLVLSLVDRVAVLDAGRLLVDTDPGSIRGHPVVQEIYLGRARTDA